MPHANTLHAGPTAGFDQPFELLQACHDRMVHNLGLMERLAAHLVTHGADAQARDAAGALLRYFDTAAPLHHDDEERHVLPRLREAGHAAMAARLRGEHQVMEQAWAALRPDLLAVQAGTLLRDALPAARARWSAYAALYRRHLAAEERLAFPVARAGLAPQAARAMGEDMARRRGATFAPG
jgi:hemerythrin-like domain-containing protein